MTSPKITLELMPSEQAVLVRLFEQAIADEASKEEADDSRLTILQKFYYLIRYAG